MNRSRQIIDREPVPRSPVVCQPSTGSTRESAVGVEPEISASGSSPHTASWASGSNMPCIQLWLATTECTQAVEPQAVPGSAARSTCSA